MILAERDRLLAEATLQGRAWCRGVDCRQSIGGWWGCTTPSSPITTDVCLLAVGGTGRGEMSPRSDVDVMVVHRGSAEEIEASLSDLWYPIWDTGLHLGHSLHAANATLTIGDDHLDTATAMLSGRCLAGDRSLADEVLEEVQRAWRTDAAAWLPLLRERGLARHRADGEVAFLLEPNIKEGRGGLRDMHELRWIDASGRGIVTDKPGSAGGRLRHLAACPSRACTGSHRSTARCSVWTTRTQSPLPVDFGDADDLMAAVSSAARTLVVAVRSGLAGGGPRRAESR